MNKKIILVIILLITTLAILSAVNAEDTLNNTKLVKSAEKKNVITTQEKNVKTEKKPVTLTAKNIETKATYVNLSAKVTDGNTKVDDGYLIYKFNGVTLTDSNKQTIMTPVKNGEASLSYKLKPGMSAKNYTLTYVFLKSDKYARTEQKTKITVIKSNIDTNLKDVTVAQGQNFTLSSKFVDEFGQDLNRISKMAIKIGGKTNQIFNITNGNFQTTLKTDTLKKGDYKLTVIAGENNAYKENRTNIVLKVINFDKYVSFTGRGQKTGNNWENTQPIADAIEELNQDRIHKIANLYLDEGTYNLGTTGKTYAIQIEGSRNLQTLNIIGKGKDKTILSGNGKCGILYINNPHIKLNMKGMTLTQGKANWGGGVYSLSSTTTLNNMKFTHNKGANGAGYSTFLTGDSNITVSDCIFTNNDATAEGGAIYIHSSSGKHEILLHKVSGINNHAVYGGVLSTLTLCPTNIVISKSTMNNNDAKYGAAIFDYAKTGNAQLTINNKNQFNNNRATENGGAINIGSEYGDTYLNVTGKNVFTNNYATIAGGGIYDRVKSKNIYISLDSDTFKNNSARYGGSLYDDAELNTIVKINNTKFSENKALNGNGGSVWSKGSKFALINVTNSVVENNQALKGNGSGIGTLAVQDAIVNVYNTTFLNNQAYLGGGVYTWSNLTDAIVRVNNSNFVNNKAEKEGAAIYTTTDVKTVKLYLNYDYFDNNYGKGMGGTIYNRADYGTIINTIYNSKIYHSSSYENGSAICNRATIDLIFESKNSEFKDCKTYNQGRATIYNYAANSIKANLIDTFIHDNNSTIGSAISNIARNKIDFNITSSRILNNKVTDQAAINDWATNDIKFNIKGSILSNNNGGSKATVYTYSSDKNIVMSVMNSSFNNNQGTNGGVFSNVVPKGSISTALNKDIFTNNKAISGPVMFNIAEKGKVTETVTNSQITNNKASDKGALVNYANDIKETLTNTIIQDNNSTIGAAITNTAQNKLDFDITSSKIINNKVTGYASINDWAANDIHLNIKDSTISGNTGGTKATVYTVSSQKNIIMTITNSLFTNNQGTNGGVFSNVVSKGSISTALNKDTFSNNKAISGPVMFNIAEKGKVTETVTNSQITNNKATDKGAFVNSASNIVVTHKNDKISGNTANKGSYLWNSRIPNVCNIENDSWGNNPDWSKLLFATPKPTKWSI